MLKEKKTFDTMIFLTWTSMFFLEKLRHVTAGLKDERDKHSSPDYANQLGNRFSTKEIPATCRNLESRY